MRLMNKLGRLENKALEQGMSQKSTFEFNIQMRWYTLLTIMIFFFFQQIWQNSHLPALLPWSWDMWYHSGICTKLYSIFDLPFSPRCLWQGNLDDMLCDWWELLSSIFLFLAQKSEGMRNGGQGVWLCLLLIIFPWTKGMTNNPSPSYLMHLSSVTRWMHANCNLVWSLLWAHVGTVYVGKQPLVCLQNMPGTLIEAQQNSFLTWQCLLTYWYRNSLWEWLPVQTCFNIEYRYEMGMSNSIHAYLTLWDLMEKSKEEIMHKGSLERVTSFRTVLILLSYVSPHYLCVAGHRKFRSNAAFPVDRNTVWHMDLHMFHKQIHSQNKKVQQGIKKRLCLL